MALPAAHLTQLLSAESADSSWPLASCGGITWNPPMCPKGPLHHASHCCFGQHCLPNGTHLVLMGDSLMRYQYLSLIYGLHFGSPLPAEEIGHDRSEYYTSLHSNITLVNEHRFRSWPSFLRGSNCLFHPYEKCDCHRNYSLGVENRYYHRADCNVSVTFMFVTDFYRTPEYSAYQTSGRWRPPSQTTQQARAGAGSGVATHRGCVQRHDFAYSDAARVPTDGDEDIFRQQPQWSMSALEAMEKVAGGMAHRPTVFVVNSGPWAHSAVRPPCNANLSDEQGVRREMATLDELRVKMSAVAMCGGFWSTTKMPPTYARPAGCTVRTMDVLPRRVFGSRGIFDCAAVTDRATDDETLDGLHYTPGVYNAVNEALLAQLVPKIHYCWRNQHTHHNVPG